MSYKHVRREIRTPFARRGILKTALIFAGALSLNVAGTLAYASAEGSTCAEVYESDAAYPTLPESTGPDIVGEAGVLIYLEQDRAIVELDGCLYEANRPVEIDFAGLDFVTLLVELPDHREGGQVFVSEDDTWVETLDVTSPMFSHAMSPNHALGFEIASYGQSAPTGPLIITKPSGGNPDPD